MRLGVRAFIILAIAAAIVPRDVSAQTTQQLWANVTLDWHPSPRVTYSVDFEPKAVFSAPPDQPGWANMDLTPSAEFAATTWLDLVGEGIFGRTRQTDNLRTTETSVRGGVRLHFFSQRRPLFKELLPTRRLVQRNLLRWERRRLSYSGGEPSETGSRFRDRIEFLFPVNRPKLGEDGTVHLIADWEWFVPFTDQQERFANRRRFRGGFGYRRNRRWQMAALYMRTNSRDTLDEPFTTSENIIDLQIKRVW